MISKSSEELLKALNQGKAIFKINRDDASSLEGADGKRRDHKI